MRDVAGGAEVLLALLAEKFLFCGGGPRASDLVGLCSHEVTQGENKRTQIPRWVPELRMVCRGCKKKGTSVMIAKFMRMKSEVVQFYQISICLRSLSIFQKVYSFV